MCRAGYIKAHFVIACSGSKTRTGHTRPKLNIAQRRYSRAACEYLVSEIRIAC